MSGRCDPKLTSGQSDGAVTSEPMAEKAKPRSERESESKPFVSTSTLRQITDKWASVRARQITADVQVISQLQHTVTDSADSTLTRRDDGEENARVQEGMLDHSRPSISRVSPHLAREHASGGHEAA